MVRRFIERESDVKKWLGVLLLPFLCGASFAQTSSYPDRPITLIVTAAAGGVTDVAARAVGQELSKAWGQPVIIENRGGAAHILGAQSVAKADPDGYTLMVGEAGTFTINPTVYPPGKLPYDADKDFVPISGLVRINQALIGDNKLPAANAAELIALARQKPGQLTHAGTAGICWLRDEHGAVRSVSGTRRGARAQRSGRRQHQPDVGERQPGAAGVPRRPGQDARHRQRQAHRAGADIPTVAESGLPGYQAVTWFGLFGPAKLPSDIVGKLNAQVAKIFADPDFRAHFLEPQMFEAMPNGSPEEFAAYIPVRASQMGKSHSRANITLE